jgi:hypothetical protein
MSNLAEEYPKEQARLRALLEQYTAIGPAGAFGHAMISQVLARADRAAVRSDLPAMIVSFRK